MKLKKLTATLLAITLGFASITPISTATEVPTTVMAKRATGVVPKEATSFTPDASAFPSYDVTLPAGETSVVQEITIKHSGYLYIPVATSGTAKSVTVTLYADKACTSKVTYGTSLSAGSLSGTIKTSIPKAGTYYLQFSVYSGMESDTQFTLNPYCYNSDTRTIAEKKTIYSYSGKSDIIYHKITVPKDGYITINADSDNSVGSLYVQLFNSKRNEVSNSSYVSDTTGKGQTAFAVKKGTYYIGTKASDIVRLKYTFTPVSEKSGTSKKKAVTIGKKKTATGLVQYTDNANKADYYKVKLTKKQVLSLSLSTKGCGNVSFKIIPASSKVILFGNRVSLSNIDKDTIKTKDKMPAGTYYIEVMKSAKTTTGSYSIKFN